MGGAGRPKNHRVRPNRKTDQWVQRGCGVRLVALWLCGRTAKDMRESAPIAKRWAPELEANPRGVSWEQRAEAELQARDTPDSGAVAAEVHRHRCWKQPAPGSPPRSARVVLVPRGAIWEQRAKAGLQASDMPEPDKPSHASPESAERDKRMQVPPRKSRRSSSTSRSRSRFRSRLCRCVLKARGVLHQPLAV